MSNAGRVGDPSQKQSSQSAATQGSPDTLVDGRAALRVGDEGKGWKAKKGSKSVFINGQPAHRVGDDTTHDNEKGALVNGSPHLFIGDRASGTAPPLPHDRTLTLNVRDAMGRSLKNVTVEVSCPHQDDVEKTFDGSITLTGLCTAAHVVTTKHLQYGETDPGGASGGLAAPAYSIADRDDGTTALHAVVPATPAVRVPPSPAASTGGGR